MTDEIEPIVDPVEGEGGAGETPAEPGGEGTQEETPIKIGDKEYTPKQLTEFIQKSVDYDALLPDYTRKAQALATLAGGKNLDTPQEDLPSFLKEGWKPKNFSELGSAIKEAVEWGEKRSQKAQETKTLEAAESKKQVDEFVVEVRKSDKEFDDKEFFQYIARHKAVVRTVDDLRSAYSSYSEANADGKLAERRALLNKVKRAEDSVSKPASGADKLPYDANKIRTDGGIIVDAAREALSKLK